VTVAAIVEEMLPRALWRIPAVTAAEAAADSPATVLTDAQHGKETTHVALAARGGRGWIKEGASGAVDPSARKAPGGQIED
jgi:hypothetical protein